MTLSGRGQSWCERAVVQRREPDVIDVSDQSDRDNSFKPKADMRYVPMKVIMHAEATPAKEMLRWT